ncbi:MAG: ParB N-terminal domain-containing protein [Oscillospiraceae bacterium]|nr:ParB N-terminal domain-containing protein [Oscillospiraceae bacterium]
MYEATLESAVEYGRQNRIEEWLQEYLCGEGDNKGLADGLKLEPREYEGPKLMNLDLFKRSYGPEPDMKFRIREDDTEQIKWFWFNTGGIQERYRAGNWDMPPLIINNDDAVYELSDGNHRLEALKMLGVKEYWVILWRTADKFDHD